MTKEKMKDYYEKGLWNLNMINTLLAKGKITQDDYNYILGGN